MPLTSASIFAREDRRPQGAGSIGLRALDGMTESTIGGKRGRAAAFGLPSLRGAGRGVLLPTIFAVVLAGILALELLSPFAGTSPVNDAPATSTAASAAKTARRDVPGDAAPADTAAILARPLFAPSRRVAQPAAVAAKVEVAEPPRLAGVIVSPTGSRAIFAHDAGKQIVVTAGASVDGYVVKSIAPDMVLLTGPGGERVVRITYDPRMRVVPHPLSATNLDAPK